MKSITKQNAVVSLPSLLVLILLFSGVVLAQIFLHQRQQLQQQAAGNVIYVSPGDNLGNAVSQLAPGDTLIFHDGTYTGSLPASGIHGTATALITIEAEHDGMAIIDGQNNVTTVIDLSNSSYVLLQGFVARNAIGSVVRGDGSNHVTVSRITAYNAGSGNTNCFSMSNGASYDLVVDSASWGRCRYGFLAYHSSNITFRRTFAKWEQTDNFSPAPRSGYGAYGSTFISFENVIGYDIQPTTNVSDYFSGVWETSNGPATHDISYYGSIFYHVLGDGIRVNDLQAFPNTIIKDSFFNNPFVQNISYPFTKGAGVEWVTPVTGSVTNNVFLGNNIGINQGNGVPTVTNNVFTNNTTAISGNVQGSYNDYWQNSQNGGTPGMTDKQVDPGYDTAKYGLGAYFFVPANSSLKGGGQGGSDIGANIIYEYENGQLTNKPLWPWPMEDRIKAEKGISVTWSSGGGFWNTLDGVYPNITITPPPSITSTPMPTPTQGVTPTPTPPPCQTPPPPTDTPLPSGVTPTDTPTQQVGTTMTPTNIPSPLPTGITPTTLPTPTLGPAIGTLALHFEGIDPQNNPIPHHPQRQVVLSFFPAQDFTQNPVATLAETVTFSQSDPNGSFVNSSIALSSIPQGSYYILAKSPEGSLQELLNNASPVTIAPGQTVVLNGPAPVTLRMGDLDNDNSVDITDYNILIDCFDTKASSPACKAHQVSDSYQTNFADLNDDGVVNGIDYNILLRRFGEVGVGKVQVIPGVPMIAQFNTTPCAMTTPTDTPHPTPTAPPQSNGFAQVCGSQICINGKPFHVHGATAYGQYSNAVSEMALAKQGNINTLEIVEFENIYHSLSDMMSSGTWTKVDNFIAQAGKNGIHVILNLSSYGQSLQAAGQNPTGDWQPFLSFVANHVNTVTGVKYADDPTILMVEFWGEIDAPNAGIHPGSTGTTATITAFYKRSAAEWKALDPNHIVSSGGFSYLNLPNAAGIDWQSIMADPNNQVCDIEINSSGDRSTTVPMVSNYCKGLNKPWFLSAWSSCYQAGGGDLTNEPDPSHMATHAQDMYMIEKGDTPAVMPAIGSDFWNLAPSNPTPGTCDLSPQFPTVWSIIQSN